MLHSGTRNIYVVVNRTLAPHFAIVNRFLSFRFSFTTSNNNGNSVNKGIIYFHTSCGSGPYRVVRSISFVNIYLVNCDMSVV